MAAMTQITKELMYEMLQQLQAGQAELKAGLLHQRDQFIRVREDINSSRGDDLRRETLQAQMDARLQRIEARLNLTDAE
jgi:hypothetical protein